MRTVSIQHFAEQGSNFSWSHAFPSPMCQTTDKVQLHKVLGNPANWALAALISQTVNVWRLSPVNHFQECLQHILAISHWYKLNIHILLSGGQCVYFSSIHSMAFPLCSSNVILGKSDLPHDSECILVGLSQLRESHISCQSDWIRRS